MSSVGMPTVRLNDPFMQWEYKLAAVRVTGFFGPNVNVDQLGDYLNGAGDQGWELVTVVDINRGNGATAELLAILKRPRHG